MATTLSRFPSATGMAMTPHQSLSRPSSGEMSSDASEFFSQTASHAYFHHYDAPSTATEPAAVVKRESPVSSSSSAKSSWVTACPHLQKHVLGSEAQLARLRLAAGYSARFEHVKRSRDKTRRRKAACSRCEICQNTLSRAFLCLDCGTTFCGKASGRNHVSSHTKQEGHFFYWDLRSSDLYCAECEDYVHHPVAERVVAGQHVLNDLPASLRAHVPGSSPRKPVGSSALSIEDVGGVTENLDPRGLRNLGQTCYMSVILQAFLVNPLLRVYFLSDQHNRALCTRTSAGQPCLLCELDLLFSECCSSNPAPFGPANFLHTVWQSSPEISGYIQQDAHEFLISTLNLLHTSSAEASDVNCSCIAHATFAGSLRSEVKCGRCHNRSHSVDPFLDLSLDLSVGDKAALSAGPNTLEDCLRRYTRPEKLPAKEYVCSTCGDTEHDSTKQLSILKLPPVLCIQLKRFEHTGSSHKIDTPIRYPLNLDMGKYTSSAVTGQAESPEQMYELSSIIAHEGTLANGHYTSICRGADDFWCFDDEKVRRAPISEVLNARAYLLIYVKI